MSAMQKAIRRGREDLALSAAATLLRDAPDKLWRRIGCIAYEDVWPGEPGGGGTRDRGSGRKTSSRSAGRRMGDRQLRCLRNVPSPEVPGGRCRAADDLLMACELHPAYAQARAELSHLTTRALIMVATGQGSVHERALALWYALGTDRDRSTLVSRRG